MAKNIIFDFFSIQYPTLMLECNFSVHDYSINFEDNKNFEHFSNLIVLGLYIRLITV